ncbi:NAD(P)/FAD-dependent oxidoreductase [Candidatus Neomarinimicrobiota bacterium]
MYQLAIIGAGAVGLSIARYFQVERGWTCLVIEKEEAVGQGISSRNSEVIHAGIYYPTDSLKAKLCVRGKERLYHYLDKNNLPHRRCGKYIMAPPIEMDQLAQLEKQSQANGVEDLRTVSGKDLQEIYPSLACWPALYSPGTGIFAVASWMHHLRGEFQAADGDLALNTRFISMSPVKHGFELDLEDLSGEHEHIQAGRVVNAAGLSALEVAEQAGFECGKRGFALRFCKGSYFKVPDARGLFHHLIYPLPGENFLGIHVKLDLLDEIGLGPDAVYQDENVINYVVDPSRAEQFRSEVRQYWLTVDEFRMEPDWAGIRPHLFMNDSHYRDFIITHETEAGCPGWVNLLGMDSPGLTAAMELGPYIEILWGD